MAANADKVFAGSIPKLYDEYLVPLIFEPYAKDLARRVALLAPARVLEIAAGTGAVTRELDETLPAGSTMVATDLNPAMLEQAKATWRGRAMEWRAADALELPFEDESFDAIACQFGVMFFPDKAKAFSEARRVLRPGGAFIFNAWDRIEENEFADEIMRALAKVFPADPPRFMARTPHGYHDRAAIEQDLAAGGFRSSRIETIAHRSRAASPEIPAIAYCQGTPWRSEIEARDAGGLANATSAAATAIAKRFGRGAVDGKIQAHVITVEK
jgi:ubiquinone/menaquinone biosynthesis C-methylase UbiE